jgi:aquaporin Z
MRSALTDHWPEYLAEAVGLALFMLSACLFGTLLGHPDSPIARAIARPLALRALMGIAMGATALALVLSPWGKRSGAHLNPALTLAFLRLGKVGRRDAAFYVAAQFAGAIAGVAGACALLPHALAHPAVRYVVTAGAYGPATAFVAELAISFGLMGAVLACASAPAWSRATPLVAAALIAAYVTLEAPLSGMSMNPARTLASALPARFWDGLWIYFVAPPLGMIAAAECWVRLATAPRVPCAKLRHDDRARCIFRCQHRTPRA